MEHKQKVEYMTLEYLHSNQPHYDELTLEEELNKLAKSGWIVKATISSTLAKNVHMIILEREAIADANQS